MQTISKALKDEMLLRREKSILKVSCSLEAKAEFVQLMSWRKHPVVIIGEKGSGKSTFLAYL
jgi:polynucleotide 5'-kinase involved in rRNA processing